MPLNATLFVGLWAGGLRNPAFWTTAAVCLWLLALWRPPAAARVPAARWWIAWLGWSLLCAVVSTEPFRALAAVSRPLTAVLFFALAAASWRADDRKLWFWSLLASGLGLGLATLYPFDPSYPHVGLLFPYYNYTVCVECMAFAACLAALGYGQPRARWGKIALGVLMALLVVLMLAARSRGGLVACATAFCLWMGRKGRLRELGAFSVGAAVCLGVSYHFWSPMLKFDRPGAYVRPEIWRSSLAIVRDDPFFGVGPGLFERGFQAHNFPVEDPRLASRFGMTTAHAHSEPLQAAAETGWPGMALLLAALAAVFAAAWRRKEKDWTIEAGLLAAAAVFSQTLFDNLWNLPGLHWLFFAALAAASGDAKPGGRASAWTRPVLALGLALAAGAWIPDWVVRRWDAQGLRTLDASKIERALNLASGDPGLWEDLARIHLRRSPSEAEAAAKALAEAEKLVPTNAAYPLMQAELLSSGGRWREALGLADRALSLEPEFLEAHLVRADAACHLGAPREAADELKSLESIRDAQTARFGPATHSGPLVLRFDPAKYKAIGVEIAKGCK